MKTATIAEMPHRIAAPQPPRSATEYAERAEQEARIREGDHEAVVPPKRLEELLFLRLLLSPQSTSVGDAGAGVAGAACARTYHGLRTIPSAAEMELPRAQKSRPGGALRSRSMRAPLITITLRLRRLDRGRLRRSVDVPDVRKDVGHEPDSGRRLRRAAHGRAPVPAARARPAARPRGDPDPARRRSSASSSRSSSSCS